MLDGWIRRRRRNRFRLWTVKSRLSRELDMKTSEYIIDSLTTRKKLYHFKLTPRALY
jgi:hypothetical protein